MRRKTILGCSVLCFALAVLGGCRYDDSITLKYIGKYQCRQTVDCYGALGTCHTVTESIISIRKGKTDTTFEFMGGDYYFNQYGCSDFYHGSFCVTGDSLHYYCMCGGLGGGTHVVIHGKKIDCDP